MIRTTDIVFAATEADALEMVAPWQEVELAEDVYALDSSLLPFYVVDSWGATPSISLDVPVWVYAALAALVVVAARRIVSVFSR